MKWVNSQVKKEKRHESDSDFNKSVKSRTEQLH